MIFADRFTEKIIELKSPLVVGLDPNLELIPDVYKLDKESGDFKTPGRIIYEFNRDVIDSIEGFAPAVKPQIAYYEAYGIDGLIAFEKTIEYAKKKGLLVIDDAKRNDIGSTAQAYANGHLGRSLEADGKRKFPVFDADALTVNPYLGSDGIEPFVDACDSYDKGIFVLVKTSNPSSGDFQDRQLLDGSTLYETVAGFIQKISEKRLGKYYYSSVGAVVGATYPKQSMQLRKIMKNSYFLVPGYGKQGGSAEDVMPCFDENGLGAVVNSSRGILYAYLKEYDIHRISKKQFCEATALAVRFMREDIVGCLHTTKKDMYY